MHLQGQNFIDLLVSKSLWNTTGSVIAVPDVLGTRPVVWDVLISQLERHLHTSGYPVVQTIIIYDACQCLLT